MGILDDAIREHLDLKRKHGATRDDVERLEQEAFGPATRPGDPEFADQEATAEDVAEPERGADWSEVLEENTEDHEGAPVEDDLGEVGESPAERARAEYTDLDDTVDHPAVPEPAGGFEPEATEHELPPAPEEEPAEAAIFDQGGEPEEPEAEADSDPAAGFDPDAAEEDEIEDEDLLEETPDFLEDTPEGERLWFEQGEPKDFDFDD